MDLGIVPWPDPQQGGVFQYGITVLRALARSSLSSGSHRISVICPAASLRDVAPYASPAWRQVSPLPLFHTRWAAGILRRMVGEAVAGQLARRVRGWESRRAAGELATRPEIGRWYRRHGVKFIFWTANNGLSFECGVPFVMAVHDLQHRFQPEFQDAFPLWEVEAREFLYQKISRAATLLVADSEIGRADILEAYGKLIRPEQIKVLPFVPPPHISAADPERQVAACRARWRLPLCYFFYPAQFWPHKNHAVIVRALALLRERARDLAVVFAGSWQGQRRTHTFREVMKLAVSLGVADRLSVLGFVPDALMGGLYLGAQALVMPTLLGPTNIPILEAWLLGCPVVTSDIRGVREQAGDAALLVNPHSPEELAEAMWQVWREDSLRLRLADAGRRRLASCTEQDFGERLAAILKEGYARAEIRQGRK